jgi:CRP-like cAMP-binding protein
VEQLNSLIALLKNEGLSENLIEKVLEICTIKNIKSQEVIVQHGQVCKEMFYVVTGGFICLHYNEKLETERTVNFYLNEFQPFMTCLESFTNGSPSEFSLKAFQNSTVLSFSKEKLFELINTEAVFKTLYLNQITQVLIAENDFRVKLITLPPDELYHHITEKYPKVAMTVPSKFIAEFIGISAEWLSKIKRKD